MKYSEEELKAIEETKDIIEEVTDNTKEEIPTYIFDRDIKCLPILINLISKQQKEIKTLSTQNAKMSERHIRDSEKLKNSISKDKIREKINERQFELQQEYKDFKDDVRLNTLQEIYYIKR